jgi:cell division inhibitor SepF
MKLFDNIWKFLHPYDEVGEDDPIDYQTQDRPERERPEREHTERAPRSDRRDDDRRAKVVNLHPDGQLKVVLMKPVRFDEDANAIAEHLAQKRTVILNMENTDSETSRRLLDFATGVVFSCDGKLRRVASKTYIVAPGLVDLSGELVDGMDGGGLYM